MKKSHLIKDPLLQATRIDIYLTVIRSLFDVTENYGQNNILYPLVFHWLLIFYWIMCLLQLLPRSFGARGYVTFNSICIKIHFSRALSLSGNRWSYQCIQSVWNLLTILHSAVRLFIAFCFKNRSKHLCTFE